MVIKATKREKQLKRIKSDGNGGAVFDWVI